MDNYVRSGLTFVGPLSPSGVAVETDVETAASFSAVPSRTVRAPPARPCDSSAPATPSPPAYWDAASAWMTAATTTVGFDATQIGVYALAAQDGTVFAAPPSTTSPSGSRRRRTSRPAGSFMLQAAGDAPYLVTDGNALALTDERPAATLRLPRQPPSARARSRSATGDAAGGAGRRRSRPRRTRRPCHRSSGSPTPAAARSCTARLHRRRRLRRARRRRRADRRAEADAVRFTLCGGRASAVATLDIDGDATALEIATTCTASSTRTSTTPPTAACTPSWSATAPSSSTRPTTASFTGLTAWQLLNRERRRHTGTVVNDDSRLNDTNRNYLRLDRRRRPATASATPASTTASRSKAGAAYDFSVWARSTTAQDLTVRLEDTAPAPPRLPPAPSPSTAPTPGRSTPSRSPRPAPPTPAGWPCSPARASTVGLDMVSLFPTRHLGRSGQRQSVLRKDLAEKIAALEPVVPPVPGRLRHQRRHVPHLRGGGYTDRRRTYQWKETIGPVEERPTN